MAGHSKLQNRSPTSELPTGGHMLVLTAVGTSTKSVGSLSRTVRQDFLRYTKVATANP